MLKGFILQQYLWTIRWGTGYTTTLPLQDFTQRYFLADFIRLRILLLSTFRISNINCYVVCNLPIHKIRYALC